MALDVHFGYAWSIGLSEAENRRRADRFFALQARLSWKHPPLRRIMKLTRREIARVVRADRPTTKSNGRTVKMRRHIRSYDFGRQMAAALHREPPHVPAFLLKSHAPA